MSNDIYSILKRFDSIAEGQNAQQKSVPQLPALFKPKDISPVLGAPEKQHPTHNYFVGGESAELDEVSLGDYSKKAGMSKAMAQMNKAFGYPGDHDTTIAKRSAGLGRAKTRSDTARAAATASSQASAEQALRDKYAGVDIDAEIAKLKPAIAQAYNDYQYGASNTWSQGRDEYNRLSAKVQELERAKKIQGLAEGVAKEDVVTKDRKSLGDYFQSVADAVKTDPALKDKVVQHNDMVGPAVKTITTDGGHEIKIHGNEDDGFRITVRNRPMKSTFKSLDEASIACEMFCNRQRQIAQSADYVEERT
jgi:hypothetical protein